MGVEATIVDKGPESGEPQAKNARLAVIAIRTREEMVGPSMPGGGEPVITHDGMIICVVIDPFHDIASMNRERKGSEAVFLRDDHLVDAGGPRLGGVYGDQEPNQ